MKNPLLDGVLLIPWPKQNHFLLLSILVLIFSSFSSAFENRFKSRGASLVSQINSQPQQSHTTTFTRTLPAATYFYYDPITPVSVRQRRQRHFGADQSSPVVVLQTGRKTPATVQIKELPPLIRSRQVHPSRYFVQQPQQHPTTAATTSFARFNQFGQNFYTISPASAVADIGAPAGGVAVTGQQNSAASAFSSDAAAIPPPPPPPAPPITSSVVENRFNPILKPTNQPFTLPQPEAVIGRLPGSTLSSSAVPTLPSLSPLKTARTLFGGFSSRSTTSSTVTTASASTLSTLIATAPSSTSTLSQRPFLSSTTRFLRPSRLTSSASFGPASVFQR